jgi:hypothetical protein
MRRLMAWIAGGLVLAAATFGTLAVVEASMASAAPTAACTQAQARVQQAKFQLFLYEEFGAILSLGGPHARADVNHLISIAEQQLSNAQQAAYAACNTVTTTTTTSSFTTTTVTETVQPTP